MFIAKIIRTFCPKLQLTADRHLFHLSFLSILNSNEFYNILSNMENVTAVEKNSESPENPSVENNITPQRIASPDKDQDAEPESSQNSFQIAILMGALCVRTFRFRIRVLSKIRLQASVFLAALDITIISTPLATISEYFHSSAAYTWVGSTYMLADAAGTPVWGKLSDIWGRKPLLLVATAIFFLGSALSGAAVNIDMLIAGRAVQGFAGGGLLTLVNICISDMFSMRSVCTFVIQN